VSPLWGGRVWSASPIPKTRSKRLTAAPRVAARSSLAHSSPHISLARLIPPDPSASQNTVECVFPKCLPYDRLLFLEAEAWVLLPAARIATASTSSPCLPAATKRPVESRGISASTASGCGQSASFRALPNLPPITRTRPSPSAASASSSLLRLRCLSQRRGCLQHRGKRRCGDGRKRKSGGKVVRMKNAEVPVRGSSLLGRARSADDRVPEHRPWRSPSASEASAGGGNRTHTPLSRPRILSLSDCNFLTSAETPIWEILAEKSRISIHAYSGSLVAALARVSPRACGCRK